MIKAIIRFLIFQIPSIISTGLEYILFENREVIQVEFILKKQKPKQKDNDKKVLEKYLKSCFDIVNKEENEKKRLDKD